MALQRNDDGSHSVTILVPPDRTQREHYEKLPLVRQRNGLIGFILDLFRKAPNPFLASPIAAAVDRNLKLEKQARAAEKGDTHTAEALTTQIEAALDRYLRGSIDKADEKLDRLDQYILEEKDFLENCRPAAIRSSLDVEIEKIAADVNAELGPPATALARKQIALDNFVHDNQVERTIWWGRPITRQSIYLILGITLFEFILNTAFFSGSQRSGIIGGAALAMLLSITTIVLGVGFGIAYQFSHPKSEGRGWFGRIGILILLLGTLYYLLLLTLARLAGESGDIHMFATAANEIQVRPFSGLLDVPALAYFFFSIAVIAGVFYKFIDTMGHFPRIRSHRLAVDRAEHEFENIRLGIIDAARSRVDDSIKALDATPNIIQATIRAIGDLVMNYENVVDQFKNNVKDIKDASRLLAGVVRQHVGAGPQDVTIDYDGAVREMDKRLSDFRAKAATLQEWDEIHPATIDRCRAEMSESGKLRIGEIERRCEEVKEERHEDLRGAAATPTASRRVDNVALLVAGASR
jgi:hypothetical protein